MRPEGRSCDLPARCLTRKERFRCQRTLHGAGSVRGGEFLQAHEAVRRVDHQRRTRLGGGELSAAWIGFSKDQQRPAIIFAHLAADGSEAWCPEPALPAEESGEPCVFGTTLT